MSDGFGGHKNLIDGEVVGLGHTRLVQVRRTNQNDRDVSRWISCQLTTWGQKLGNQDARAAPSSPELTLDSFMSNLSDSSNLET